MTFADLFTDRPSVRWALGELAGRWPETGEKIHCPFPGHDDRKPSFSVKDNDVWFCSCTRGPGDVMMLISGIEGHTGQDLISRAEGLAGEEQEAGGPMQRSHEPLRPPDFAAQYSRLVIASGSKLSTVRFRSHVTGMRLNPDYVASEWGWTDAGPGTIAMPHRSPDGLIITGIKYRRPGGSKWSDAGASYPFLYGAWRDYGYRDVLLCEGESDTVYAACCLLGSKIDVLGLPAGASGPSMVWLAQLRGRRLVIAFDGDQAGWSAMREWAVARPDARIAYLSDGADIRSSEIAVADLYSRAERGMDAEFPILKKDST
jgi:hypothetical protein